MPDATLHPFQAKGFRTIQHYKGVVLLADEMGLGKTIQALWWLKENPNARPAIIVVPAHLKYYWQHEAISKTGLHAIVLNGTKPQPFGEAQPQILILNYDILPAWLKVLQRMKPKAVLFDEVHYIKTRSAKRTKASRKLAKGVPYRIGISGTPLVNCPAELWPTLNLLWPDEFEKFVPFADRYCNPEWTPWGMQYKGATHLDELHRRLKGLGMIRRTKAEVLPELPPKQRTVLAVETDLTEYKKAESNYLKWLEDTGEHKAAKSAAKAEQITRLGGLKRLASLGKLLRVFEWIDAYLEETDDKLAIYAIHRKIIRPLHERYIDSSVCLDGSTSARMRQLAVKKFQTNKRTRLFFGQIQAAGTGITITAAPHLMFAELDWVPGNHTQAEDRIHRIGQDQPVQITYLVACGTIEEDLCQIIQTKHDVISKTLDGTGKCADKFNVYDELSKALGRKDERDENLSL